MELSSPTTTPYGLPETSEQIDSSECAKLLELCEQNIKAGKLREFAFFYADREYNEKILDFVLGGTFIQGQEILKRMNECEKPIGMRMIRYLVGEKKYMEAPVIPVKDYLNEEETVLKVKKSFSRYNFPDSTIHDMILESEIFSIIKEHEEEYPAIAKGKDFFDRPFIIVRCFFPGLPEKQRKLFMIHFGKYNVELNCYKDDKCLEINWQREWELLHNGKPRNLDFFKKLYTLFHTGKLTHRGDEWRLIK